MKKNKHHFQLLEIMIAMLLIVTCVTPALHIYMNMYRQETQTIHNYKADHIARLLHADITELMYQNAIAFEEILAGLERPLDDFKNGKKLKNIGFTGYYTLSVLNHETVKKEQLVKYLAGLNIVLENKKNKEVKKYEYIHYIKGHSVPSRTIGQIQDDIIDQDDNEEFRDSAKDTFLTQPKLGKKNKK